MMKPEEMNVISLHLIDALNKEDLTTREAAIALKLSPGYVSMAKNPKLWGSMSKFAWDRLIQWHNSREKITEFKIPEDEPILMPKDQVKLDASKSANKAVKKAPKKPDRNDTGEEWAAQVDAFNPPDYPLHPPEAHLRVCLDLEITLTVNGQKVKI